MIESIPNISEGRRPDVIRALVEVVRQTPGVRVLDESSDVAHNRSVLTYAAAIAMVEQASVALVERAVSLIDLRHHSGVHPRIGAIDVMPFVPLEGATMADCVALAQRVGSTVAGRFGLSVFLYEEAATSPARRRLEDIRRGEFEGLTAKMADLLWRPDFGPTVPHASAGAIAIGARRALIAFNVNLASDRVDIARQIASTIRERDGGLPGVKALGLMLADRGIVQVSMNLTDYERTSPSAAFEAVEREARRRGVDVLESELIGLIPRAALRGTTPDALRLKGFSDSRILEVRLGVV